MEKKNYSGWKKEELVIEIEEMENVICEMENVLVWFELLLGKKEEVKGDGRKGEVLGILKRVGKVSIREIGKELGIEDKNVSSILSGLRKMGVNIGTDSKGRKFIEKDE